MKYSIDTLRYMGYKGRAQFNRQKITRLESGYRMKDVARLLGLKSVSLLSRWENGESMPTIENLFKLSIIYRCLPNYLYWDWYCDLRDEIAKREKKLLLSKQHAEKMERGR